MSSFDKGEGGFVFLSHSHQDIAAVRKIRNQLEAEGFEPLMFYLKCLTDDDEVEDLIKREIDAREWFVYVDSENARNSRWVQTEREYIEKTGKKNVFVISLKESQEQAAERVRKIMRTLNVFISCPFADRNLGSRVYKELLKRDLQVFHGVDNFDGLNGQRLDNVIRKKLDAAIERGCVLLIITKNSINSMFCLYEAEYALTRCERVIPMIVGDVLLPANLEFAIADKPWIRVDDEATDEQIKQSVSQVIDLLMMKYRLSVAP